MEGDVGGIGAEVGSGSGLLGFAEEGEGALGGGAVAVESTLGVGEAEFAVGRGEIAYGD